MADKIYPKGIRLFPKRQNQPDWIIATGLITISEFGQFIKDNEALLTEYNGQRQLKIQILAGKDGPYVTVDTWKPTVTDVHVTEQATAPYVAPTAEDDLPF